MNAEFLMWVDEWRVLQRDWMLARIRMAVLQRLDAAALRACSAHGRLGAKHHWTLKQRNGDPEERYSEACSWDGKALSARVTTCEVDAHRDESFEKLLLLWLHGRIVGPLVSAKRSTNL